MNEYGSDFHCMEFKDSTDKISFPNGSLFFGCGRYAISHLLKYYFDLGEWKNIFIPEYYCYTVVKSIADTGIGIKFYGDYPLADDDNIIGNISFQKGDVLLRMNYYGLRDIRSNANLSIPVIEDHSHSLFSNWAKNSNADWCVASLRKTLPIPDGGIVWSPKNFGDIGSPEPNGQHELLVETRMEAMRLKSLYLSNNLKISKDRFLEKFKQTENAFANLNNCSMSNVSDNIILNLPNNFDAFRRRNFEIITSMIDQSGLSIVRGDYEGAPFSLILLFESNVIREKVRSYLIAHKLYPAVLWSIDNNCFGGEISSFSNRMLSIPIDFRYSPEDMVEMSKIINEGVRKSYRTG